LAICQEDLMKIEDINAIAPETNPRKAIKDGHQSKGGENVVLAHDRFDLIQLVQFPSLSAITSARIFASRCLMVSCTGTRSFNW
jgi:hypothetical protein